MELVNDNLAMELTNKQVWSLLKEELLTGFDAGELTEEEFATELKTLRVVVDNSTFTLVASPTAGDAEE
tara:strand:- start:4776 stop:4982 length:207 start_codon:yes stop_codon:yes gene_type:complete